MNVVKRSNGETASYTVENVGWKSKTKYGIAFLFVIALVDVGVERFASDTVYAVRQMPLVEEKITTNSDRLTRVEGEISDLEITLRESSQEVTQEIRALRQSMEAQDRLLRGSLETLSEAIRQLDQETP